MSLKDIQQRQDKLRAMAERISRETNGERIMQLAEEMRVEAAELERVALAFQAKMDKESSRARSTFEVVLTPDQRQRIRAKTGVTMESILIDDATGVLNASMVSTKPQVIEAYALREAERRKLEGPAKEAAKRDVDEHLAALEAQSDQMAEKVRELRADPKFQEIMNFDKKKR